jgi:hypothetical protein
MLVGDKYAFEPVKSVLEKIEQLRSTKFKGRTPTGQRATGRKERERAARKVI